MGQMNNTLHTSGYAIHIGSIKDSIKTIDLLAYSSVVVLVDENTHTACYPILKSVLSVDHSLIVVQAGEQYKTVETCLDIWRQMLNHGIDRKSLCINLGGGVVTDMGGYAAACYMRGIDFVHIPTTLLSQVDASIGGKLGVDLDSMKNLVGLIKNPQAVLIDPDFLATLSDREYRSGYAEILKHGLIRDAAYFSQAVSAYPVQGEDLMAIIHRSLVIKNDIVVEDPREKGVRKLLNFGHTIGHALESLSLQNDARPLLHGEAIAIGMICEAHVAHQLGKIDASTLRQISDDLVGIYGKENLPYEDVNQVWDIMLHDKKNQGGRVLCTLIDGIGEGCYNIAITKESVAISLRYYTEVPDTFSMMDV